MRHPWRHYCLALGGGAGNLWGQEGRWQVSSSDTLHQPRETFSSTPTEVMPADKWKDEAQKSGPDLRSQILFSVEAFTSQIHSKSSSHQEFFWGRTRELVLNLTNVCVWTSSGTFIPLWVVYFPFPSYCSIAMSLLLSLCVNMHILCIKICFGGSVCLFSSCPKPEAQKHSLHMQGYLHSTMKCSNRALDKTARTLEAVYVFLSDFQTESLNKFQTGNNIKLT